MSLFGRLVSKALQNSEGLSPLRVVVEKELLHHDILREMSASGLLKKMTFIGGTDFVELLEHRSQQLRNDPTIRQGFIHEMRRFLPPHIVSGTVEKEDFWIYLTNLLQAECIATVQSFKGRASHSGFTM